MSTTSNDPPGLMSDEEFRETPQYERLCGLYGLSPVLPPEAADMPLGDARHFWDTYEAWRRGCSFTNRAQVAEWAAGQLAGHPSLTVTGCYGDLVTFRDVTGNQWMTQVRPADPTLIARAIIAATAGQMDGGSRR